MNKAPTVVLLVGLPCTGKSTFCRKTIGKGTRIINTDSILMQEAQRQQPGITYSEAWPRFIAHANHIAERLFIHYLHQEVDMVIDRVNSTVIARRNLLRHVPDHWVKVAICFPHPELPVLHQRIQDRSRKDPTEKSVPYTTLQEMAGRLTWPTPDEGFHHILQGSA